LGDERDGPNNFGASGSIAGPGGGLLIRDTTDPAKVGQVRVGETNFVVGRLTFNPAGAERFDLFINPARDSEPTTPHASLTGFSLRTVDSIWIRGGNNDTTEDFESKTAYFIDEIRGGTTYFDVVPEPSTALSLTLGLGLLASRRRRAAAMES
jgi:hypothetical protein